LKVSSLQQANLSKVKGNQQSAILTILVVIPVQAKFRKYVIYSVYIIHFLLSFLTFAEREFKQGDFAAPKNDNAAPATNCSKLTA